MNNESIVDRLRDMASKRYANDWAGWVQKQCTEAADEIDRLRAVLKASGEQRPAALTDWQTPAAKWLRQKAEAAKPAAEKTGWANPAHSLPGRLLRLADELDADSESAPFGLEPWGGSPTSDASDQ